MCCGVSGPVLALTVSWEMNEISSTLCLNPARLKVCLKEIVSFILDAPGMSPIREAEEQYYIAHRLPPCAAPGYVSDDVCLC